MTEMKTIRHILASIAGLTAAFSCANYDYEPWPRASVELDGPYIETYYDGPMQCELYLPETGLPYLSVSIDTDMPELITQYSAYSSGEALEQYIALKDKHGDNDFHGTDILFSSLTKICYAHDISAIELTCERDFDSSHPAGSSLMDIMRYEAYSFAPFVYGGYNGVMSDYDTAMGNIYVSSDAGEAIPAEYLSMLSCYDMFRLYFTVTPPEPGEYKMNLTVTLDDSQVKTFKIDYQQAL